MESTPQIPLPNFADLLLDAVFMVDVSGRIVYVSAACERIFGYTQEEMIGTALFDYVLPQDKAKTLEESMQVMMSKPRIGFENCYIRKDGGIANIMWSARWSDMHQLRIGVARDMTEQKRAEALQSAIYAISEAAHAAQDLVSLFREIHLIIAGLVQFAGFAVALCNPENVGFSFAYPVDDKGSPSFMQDSLAIELCTKAIMDEMPAFRSMPVLDQQGQHNHTCWLAVPLLSQHHAIGALLIKSHPGTVYSERDKELLHFVSTQSATAIERKRLHEELLQMAQQDELTGLPNRRSFQDCLRLALSEKVADHKKLAILYLDLDNFKQLNDTLGHACGDILLQEIAQRLKRSVRKYDMVARLGGDEFVVLLKRIDDPADVTAVADKIEVILGEPLILEGQSFKPSASIGIAIYPDDAGTPEQLLKYADDAMYARKKQSRRLHHDQ